MDKAISSDEFSKEVNKIFKDAGYNVLTAHPLED